MKKIVSLVLLVSAYLPLSALAQTPGGASCQYIAYGAVPTAAQWNYCFEIKQDFIGYTPVNKAGDTMQGELIAAASAAANAGLNLQPGVAPTAPANGDVWITSSGMFARINGVTYQLATSSGGPLIITSNSANALAVGPNGATNPSFNVDSSTVSAATGLNVKSAAAGAGVAVAVLSSATNDSLSIDAKGTGTISLGANFASTISLGNVSTGSITMLSPSVVLTGASGTSFAVGPNGSTNPALLIDDSTVPSVTGIRVKSAAAAAGVAVSAISSGANENLTIDAKGSGSVKINTVGTGGFGFNVGSDATDDMYYRNAGGTLTRIPIGTNSQVLTISSGIPSWQPGAAAASITVGTTTISAGTPSNLLYDNAGTLGNATIASFLTPGAGIGITGTTNATIASTVATAAGQFVGTATNDNATAGNIGELISCNLPSGSPVSMPTGSPTNICSASLTAGDWDCSAEIATPVQTANMTDLRGWMSTTSAADPGAPNGGGYVRFGSLSGGIAQGGPTILSVGSMRFSLASTTTVYLSGMLTYSGTGDTGYGFMGCRRRR